MKRSKTLGIVGASAVLVLGAAIGGPAIAAASGSAEPEIVAAVGGEHTRAATPQAMGVSTGGACRMGYNTNTDFLTPPDSTYVDNPPAGSVTITKPCAGAVVGQFTAEIHAGGGGFIAVVMRATCTATGGFVGACSVGTFYEAAPGLTFLEGNPVTEGSSTHSMNMVWPGLEKGVWRFDVLPAGSTGASLERRTFTVEAFKGG